MKNINAIENSNIPKMKESLKNKHTESLKSGLHKAIAKYSGGMLMLVIGIILISPAFFAKAADSGELPNRKLETIGGALSSKVAPGELLPVSLKLLNFGGGRKTDVLITYTILNGKKEIISKTTETVAVETTASFVKNIHIPSNAAAGNYILSASITYQDQVVPATTEFSFTVERKWFGLFQSEFLIYSAATLLLSIAAGMLGYGFIKKHQRKKLPSENSENIGPKRMFYELISDTVLTINWYTQMLLEGDAGKLKKKQEKYLQKVNESGTRMVKLLNILLDISPFELEKFMENRAQINLVHLALSSIEEQKKEIDEKRLTIIQNLDKNVPLIMGDPKLFHLIFQNLLSNAIKYTPEKGKIELSMTRKGPNITIKMADSGYGIAKNQQNEIFTKFFRADHGREQNSAGAGLGLYMVKTVVEYLGGSISFESEKNKGTTFFLVLPVER